MVAKIIVTFKRWLGTVGPVHGRWLWTCRYGNTFSEPRPNVPLCLWVTMPGRRMSSWGGFGVVFARTWVPPWRARGSWQTQSRKIQPTSRRIQPKSRKIQPTSREIQPKSLELATSRHNNINPPQTSGRGTRAWLHIQNNRDRAVCLVSSRRGLSGRCRMCNCVCIGPRVCGIEALGTGLGTGLVWARVSLV